MSESRFSAYRLIRLCLLVILFCVPVSSAHAEAWQYSGIKRIVAVSDVHGAYDALVSTLREADVMSNDLEWIGGETHLVITGDLLDRGADSRKVMDLIMRLEHEAAGTGGQVHQLLGNHEVMNLIGDLRYVADGEFAAFSDEESPQEREYWYQHFSARQPVGKNELKIRAEFNKKAPAGFFGHRRAFRADGVYGKWLLEKPVMIVINGTAFVHGGAPSYVAEHGLAGVNGSLKVNLADYITAVTALEEASVLSPVDSYREAPALLTEKLKSGVLDGEMSEYAQSVLELRKSPLNNRGGPTWYRGTALCNQLVEGDSLSAALDKINATRIVIGHTPTSSKRIQQRMGGRVIEIDTGMLKASYSGSGNALVLQNDQVEVVDEDGAQDLALIPHPVAVGHDIDDLDDASLANILSNGEIVGFTVGGRNRQLVKVVGFEKTVSAYFTALPDTKNSVPEVAAYTLDRLVGLQMVPVTVVRDIGDQKGSLQYAPAETINDAVRLQRGKGGRAICSLDKQFAAMQVFDALIGNLSRRPETMLYKPGNWQLILTGHQESFGGGGFLTSSSDSTLPEVGQEWLSVLHNMDDENLRLSLSAMLDKEQLSALIMRRDSLITNSHQ